MAFKSSQLGLTIAKQTARQYIVDQSGAPPLWADLTAPPWRLLIQLGYELDLAGNKPYVRHGPPLGVGIARGRWFMVLWGGHGFWTETPRYETLVSTAAIQRWIFGRIASTRIRDHR
jgi:hypothetical protein